MVPDALAEFFEREREPRPLPPRKPLTPSGVLTLSGLPYLPLRFDFPVPHEAMLAEALALRERAVPHREGESQGWSCLMFHGLAPHLTMAPSFYGRHEDDCGWTSLSLDMPICTTFVRSLDYLMLERVRVLILEPGGYILPHTDPIRGLGPVNVALNNPEGCEFVMEGAGVLPFAPGVAIMPAVGRRHAVWNRSAEPRLHMLINGEPDLQGHWINTLPRSYRQMWG